MAFYACEFSFDGIPCSAHRLMIYNMQSSGQGDVSFPSTGKAVTASTAMRYSNYFYGITQNDPLVFTLTFGCDMDMIDENESLDRFDIEAIASWLTGHNQMKWLEICQPDMQWYRYKCIISDLKLITYGMLPWAFSATVTCDSPYAYTYPETTAISVNGSCSAQIYNRSTYNGYYRPRFEISVNGGGDIIITNETDGHREFILYDINPNYQITYPYVGSTQDIITQDLIYKYSGLYLSEVVDESEVLGLISDELFKYLNLVNIYGEVMTANMFHKAMEIYMTEIIWDDDIMYGDTRAGKLEDIVRTSLYGIEFTWRELQHVLLTGRIATVESGLLPQYYWMPVSAYYRPVATIIVDNDSQVITSDLIDNVYDKFNMNFFRLKRGMNELQLYGQFDIKMICEFPVNVGG